MNPQIFPLLVTLILNSYFLIKTQFYKKKNVLDYIVVEGNHFHCRVQILPLFVPVSLIQLVEILYYICKGRDLNPRHLTYSP
jgi:hypothetical protein